MKVILFGATGMVGQCVLNECLKSSIIDEILIVGRRSCGIEHDKIKEIIHSDFHDYSAIEDQFQGFDACFYCLGVSSVGMSKDKYYDITFNFTAAIAEVLGNLSPAITFGFISGAGTDETEKSRTNWACVKGKAENVLRQYPFKSLSLHRPAYIKALKGIKVSYATAKYFDWLIYPLLRTFWPKYVITSEEMGLAMINSMFQEEKVRIIENDEIKRLALKN